MRARHPFDRGRRALLKRGSAAAAVAVAVFAGGVGRRADAKAAKSEMMYQEHRHDGKGCADCKFFVARDDATARGTCEIVEGPVSRDGWCVGYTPRR